MVASIAIWRFVARRLWGLTSVMSERARSRAASWRWSSTSRVTRPMRSASSLVKRRLDKQVAEAAVTDEAGEQPGQAVLGWEVELAVGRGQVAPLTATRRSHQQARVRPTPAAAPLTAMVTTSSQRSEVSVEGRSDAMAEGGDVVGCGVVAAPLDMALKRLAVGPRRRSGLRDRR